MSTDFAELLNTCLQAQGRTPAELAQLLGVHRSTVSRWLNAEKLPDQSLIQTLADRLGLFGSDRVHFVLVWSGYHPAAAQQLAQRATNSSLPPHSRMLLRRNSLFVGRRRELAWLMEKLAAPGATAAVCGMGGLGKTQLAAEYVYIYGHAYSGGVFWLSCADETVLPAEIAACGGAGHLALEAPFVTLPLAEQVDMVMRAFRDSTPRLLIFDNCEDETLLAQWRPSSGGCRILVTSRRSSWDATLGVQLLRLQPFERAESIALLQHYFSQGGIDFRLLEQIAATLGDLPLALHLAGRYLADVRQPGEIAAFLAAVQRPQQLGEILQHPSMQGGSMSPTGHIEQIDRSFEISVARLDPHRPLHACARRLLARSAYFAPGELLPRDLLFASLPKEAPEFLRRALSILVHDLGLLEMPNADSLRIHPLLAAFVREQALDPAARQAVVDTLLNANRQARKGGFLLSSDHLRQLRRLAHSALNDTDLNAADLALALGEQLWFRHDPAARPFIIAACGIYSAIGDEQDDRLARSLNLMSLVALMLGNLDLAWESIRTAVDLRSRCLPPDHYDLLMSRSNTGFLHMVRGEYAAAETVLHDVLRRLHRHPDVKMPQLLRSIHNRGVSLLLRGRYRAARRFLHLAMTRREAHLEPHSPALAQSLTYLAETLRRLGHRDEVECLHKRAYAIRAGLFGAHSPIACENLRFLGLLRCEDGRCEGLLDLQQANASLQHRFGENHVETVLVRQSLGIAYYWQGDYDRAERTLHEAWTDWEQLFGTGHSYTATALHYLALTMHAQGDQHRAYQYIDQAIQVSVANLGPAHPDTLASRQVCRQLTAGIDSSAHPAHEWGLRHALIVPM
jgi:tetratricopeptide (TPR) repeat protein/transcriptional regulator with XRE-family HTH domain